MSRTNNTYTFIFSAIVTGTFGILLALAATTLRPMQERNEMLEKKSDILAAVGYHEISKDEIEIIYESSITELTVDQNGNILEGIDAFNVNLRDELRELRRNPDYVMNLPAYIYTNTETGDEFTIIPLYGSGLWGPVWGYLSLENDMTTIKDVVFDHASETPGLGAEIRLRSFQERFIGKKIYDDDLELVSVRVLRGEGNVTNVHQVDGLAGATVTCTGVSNMLERFFELYEPFFQKQLEKNKTL